MTEVWKDIKGYEGFYQVSNLGRVKSLPRIIKRSCGKPHPVKERILKPAKDGHGYYRCAIMNNKKLVTHKVHRLVAFAFVEGFSSESYTVNHKNGIKIDNSFNNLEWMSAKDNVRHSFKTGLQKPRKGVYHLRAKLTEKDVKHIRYEFNALGISSNKIAKGYKMDKSTILEVATFKTWKHIGK